MRFNCHANPERTSRHAFTLIEVIVVVIILGILASLTIPRLTGNETRTFKLAVEQVGDLLTMYAQRQNLGQRVVGIAHNRARNSVELVVLDDNDGVPGRSASWRLDSYVQPVQLPPFMAETDVTISENGYAIDASDYPLSSEIGKERPWIEISLRGAGQNATLSLPPYGVAPILNSTYMNTGTTRTKYDLDAAGRSREDW